MKRSDVWLLLWALGGLALAALYLVAVHHAGHRSGRAQVLLLVCLVWSQLLRLIGRGDARRGGGPGRGRDG